MTSGLLCVVLDVSALGDSPHDFAASLFRAGVDWIQLRDRSVDGDAHFRAASEIVCARNEFEEKCVIVNRRSDIALAAGADGVHLGFDAVGGAEARALLGDHALVGASLHSPREVAAAALDPNLDYAHLAPIWNPLSKPATKPALGPAALQGAARTDLAVFAQGGVEERTVSEAIAAGAAGIAVTGTVVGANQPAKAVAVLRRALNRASGMS